MPNNNAEKIKHNKDNVRKAGREKEAVIDFCPFSHQMGRHHGWSRGTLFSTNEKRVNCNEGFANVHRRDEICKINQAAQPRWRT